MVPIFGIMVQIFLFFNSYLGFCSSVNYFWQTFDTVLNNARPQSGRIFVSLNVNWYEESPQMLKGSDSAVTN